MSIKRGKRIPDCLKLIDPVIYKINLNACKGNNTNNEGSLFSLSSVIITAMLLQWQVLWNWRSRWGPAATVYDTQEPQKSPDNLWCTCLGNRNFSASIEVLAHLATRYLKKSRAIHAWNHSGVTVMKLYILCILQGFF